MSEKHLPATSDCPDCESPAPVGRREFITTTAAGVAAIGAGIGIGAGFGAASFADEKKPSKNATSESLVTSLYETLTPKQKEMCAFDFNDELRHRIENNWRITDARVGRDFTSDQQQLIKDIFNSLHSEEYQEAVLGQVEHDNRQGMAACSIAMFGKPGEDFEFVFTGRHVTRRCDGNSVEGAAFGGPIFYGHAAEGFNEKPDHPGNAYWYQALRANELFQALDGKQRKIALIEKDRGERGSKTVELKGKADGLEGLAYSELSGDQQRLMKKVMDDVLAPFREVDRKESLKFIDNAGWDDLHITFNKSLDVGEDGVWDVWTVEGPHMVWYFRGHPHVHTWVHIRDKA